MLAEKSIFEKNVSAFLAFEALRSRGLTNVIQSTCATMNSAIERSPTGQGDRTASCFDNAWLCPALVSNSQSAGLQYSGIGAVISSDLRHPLIPTGDGANFNGTPSDHCPIFFDIAPPATSASE